MIISRQVPTAFDTFIDLLGVDEEGVVHIREIFERHRPDTTFDEAFAENFGGVAPPDEPNDEHQLTVIASELDSATERIVRHLNTGYGVPINVLFFRYFNDEGRSYLARTWLIEEGQAATPRIWAHIPKNGYLGVGTVIGEAMPAEAATLDVNGAEQPLRELDLNGVYRHQGRPDDRDSAEYVVPVEWISTKSREHAVWKQGFFANQNSTCKLRKKFTLDELAKQFGVTS